MYFSACDDFPDFVKEPTVTGWETWKVLPSMRWGNENSLVEGGALIFGNNVWLSFCVLLVLFSVLPAPTSSPLHSRPQKIKSKVCSSGMPFLTTQSRPNLKILWATCALRTFLCYFTVFVNTLHVWLCLLTISTCGQKKNCIFLFNF